MLAPARVIPEPAALGPPPVTLYRQPVEFRGRAVDLEITTHGLVFHGSKTSLEWQDISAVAARRGAVRIAAGGKTFRFVPHLDGVPEPSLAPLFAEIVLDSSGGSPPRASLLRSLDDAIAELKRTFRERDDPLMPLYVILPTLGFALMLAATLPVSVTALFRGAQRVPADTFVVYPRVGPLDPLVVVTALLGGLVLGPLAFRMVGRAALAQWARGVLRGWRSAATRMGLVRWAVAIAVQRQLLLAAAFLVALAVLVPTGRTGTIIDAGGISFHAPLPFFDRQVPWTSVRSVDLLSSARGYDAALTVDDGTVVTTRGQVFFGLSEYELYRFAQLQRGRK